MSTVEVFGAPFFVPKRYSLRKALGRGTYGVVWSENLSIYTLFTLQSSARDNETGEKVAIKKITPMAEHTYDAKHTLREIRIMRLLGQHQNVTSREHVDFYLMSCDSDHLADRFVC